MPLTDQHSNVQYFGSKGATNDTTPVEIIPDPGSSSPYVVDIENIGVLNEDTTAKTIVLTITGGTSRVIERVSLDPSTKWTNPTRITVTNGETLTVEITIAATTTQLPWNATYFQQID